MDDTLLIKYLQNTATAQEFIEVLDWLEASPENAKHLDQMDMILNATQVWGSKLVFTQSKKSPKITPWRKVVRWSAVAAAVILVGIGTNVLMVNHRMAQITDSMMTLSAAKGQRISVTLSDGTHVWLNSGSELSYPPLFAKKERRVVLSGEAIFDVKPDAKSPFVVETYACDAKVLGTKFDIVADERHGTYSATLMEGALQITVLANNETITMSPNEIVKLYNGRLTIEPVVDMDEYLWPEGVISLKGLSFQDLMVKLEHAFNVKIIIECDKMPTANFSWGKISISSGIEHTLQVLQYLTDFKYEKNDETGIITIK